LEELMHHPIQYVHIKYSLYDIPNLSYIRAKGGTIFLLIGLHLISLGIKILETPPI